MEPNLSTHPKLLRSQLTPLFIVAKNQTKIFLSEKTSHTPYNISQSMHHKLGICSLRMFSNIAVDGINHKYLVH